MTRIAERGVRRLVTVGGADGRSRLAADAVVDDVLRDPARPGYSCTRVWATTRTPAAPLRAEQVRALPRALRPPAGGALFQIIVLPPDEVWRGHVTQAEVQAYFAAAGSPEASCWSPDAPHPYLQCTPTLDLCVVLEGRPTLLLDRGAVTLAASDTVVQRATRHAWSNPTDRPCVIAISSHDADADSDRKPS
jgi:hypothetical protein